MGLESGWRWQIFCTVVVCFISSAAVTFFSEESPRYLVINGEVTKFRAHTDESMYYGSKIKFKNNGICLYVKIYTCIFYG